MSCLRFSKYSSGEIYERLAEVDDRTTELKREMALLHGKTDVSIQESKIIRLAIGHMHAIGGVEQKIAILSGFGGSLVASGLAVMVSNAAFDALRNLVPYVAGVALVASGFYVFLGVLPPMKRERKKALENLRSLLGEQE